MRSAKLDRSQVETMMGLTPLQEGLLFQYIQQPDSALYFEQLQLSVSGVLDTAVLRAAWAWLVDSHEVLRTVFRWEKLEKPVQIVLKSLALEVGELDWAGWPEAERAGAFADWLSADRQQPLDLQTSPYRLSLCKLGADKTVLVFSHHHILLDGWSNGLLIDQLFQAYSRLLRGEAHPLGAKPRFESYIAYLMNADKQKQAAYWTRTLSDFTEMTQLPVDALGQRHAALHLERELSAEATAQLQALAARQKVSVAAIVYAAWGICLQKYNRCDDVLFGTTVSGRVPEIAGIERMAGLFINTVPLRVAGSSQQTAADMLAAVERQLRERAEHELTPLVDIKRYSELEGQGEMFNCLIVVENYPLELQAELAPGLRLESFAMNEMTHYDLTITANLGERLKLQFSYFEPLLRTRSVERFAAHMEQVLRQLLADVGLPVASITLVDGAEQRELLALAANPVAYPQERSLAAWFEQQVERTPERPAVLFREMSLTYAELNKQANRLARLLRSHHVTDNVVVGVMIERSAELVIALLAVLKAGGAYVPIDPDYPKERIRYLATHSDAKVMLVQSKHVGLLSDSATSVVISIEDALRTAEDANAAADSNLQLPYDPERLMYMLYTSGSTGTPKGVMIKSHAFVNLLHWFIDEFQLDANDTNLLIAPSSFDLAQKNVYATLLCGGALCLFEPGLYDYQAMSRLIEQRQITLINCAPSAFYPLLDSSEADDFARLKSLRAVFLGGEPINLPKLKPWMQSAHYRGEIVNTYGPTECTDIATFSRLRHFPSSGEEEAFTIPIGRPVHNHEVYVLGHDLGLLPVGFTGELCIGGVGLARGYYQAEPLTAEKFVATPHLPSPRVYRTGDLARWLPDGQLDYIGRADFQVKIRGFRIEIGEIESRLMQYAGVKEVVVTDRINEQGHKVLVAYLTAEQTVLAAEVKLWLSGQLPAFMVPSYVVQLEQFPLSPNGKINRKAFPAPDYADRDRQHIAPPTHETEAKLLSIWTKVLATEAIGIHDQFFDRGGNSILLMQLHGLIEREYPGAMQITDLFNYPTIAKCADYLLAAAAGAETDERLVVIQTAVLPAGYVTGNRGTQGASLQLELPAQLAGPIREMARSEGVSVSDVLLGLLAYYVSQIAETDRVPVYSNSAPQQLVELVFPFDELQEVTALLRWAQRERQASRVALSEQQSLSAARDAQASAGVSLLVADKGSVSAPLRLLSSFDLIIEVQLHEPHIALTVTYNQDKVRKETTHGLLQEYTQLLDMLVQQFNSEQGVLEA